MGYKDIMESKKVIISNYTHLIKVYGYQDIYVNMDSIFSANQGGIIFKEMEAWFWDEDYEYALKIRYKIENITLENHLLVFEGIMKLLANREHMKAANIEEEVPICFEDNGFSIIRISKFITNKDNIFLSISKDEKEYNVSFSRKNRTEDLAPSYSEEEPVEFTDKEITDVKKEIEKIFQNREDVSGYQIAVEADLQSIRLEFCCNYIKCNLSLLSYGNNLSEEGVKNAFEDILCSFLRYIEKNEDTFRQLLKYNYFHVHTQTMNGDLILAYRTSEKYEIRMREEKMPEYEEMQKRKALQKQIIDFDNMEGHTFEHFCAKILVLNGFENVHVTQGSGDQGIDIIAFKDGIKYGIQCKCYSSDIGNKAVQEAFAGKAFYDCHVGIVLTNQYFTKAAVELARKNGIILWNRNKLLQMLESAKSNK